MRPTTLVSFISFISYWCISGKRCPAAIFASTDKYPCVQHLQFSARRVCFPHPRSFLHVCALKRFYARSSSLSNVYATTRAGKLDAFKLSSLYRMAKNIQQIERVQNSRRFPLLYVLVDIFVYLCGKFVINMLDVMFVFFFLQILGGINILQL